MFNTVNIRATDFLVCLHLLFKLSFYQKKKTYRNDRNFSDRQVLASSADPDQTAPRGAVF